MPIVQLALSGKGLQEQDLNDIAMNFLRTQLVTVPGAVVPYPYGGKQRQVMIDLNPAQLQAKGLSPYEVVTAVANQNLILPSGTAKIGQFEYDVDMNYSPKSVAEISQFPVKVVNDSTIYVRDVANVRHGFAPQTNIIRRDGQRGVLVSVLKAGSASTLDVVQGIKNILPRVASTLPPELKIQPLADQSIFVRAAINGVVREAILAACLTGLMILLFLGSWRSTLIIAISIPLSILDFGSDLERARRNHQHHDAGRTCAGGRNPGRRRHGDNRKHRALSGGGPLLTSRPSWKALPRFPFRPSFQPCVSVSCFFPMFFLSGVARYLFVPLAEAVVFAMLASYVLSRTLVPTLAMYLLRAKEHFKRTPESSRSFSACL